jgi:membrane protein involved in colicin uptake
MTARSRRERRVEHQHDRAEKLREDARSTELEAREHEAEVARARAEAASATAAAEAARARAAEASIDAERRAGTIDEHQADAEKLRAEQAEKLRKADDVDPYVTDGRTDAAAGGPSAGTSGNTRRDVRDDGSARSDGTVHGDGMRDEVAADEIVDPADRPRRADGT